LQNETLLYLPDKVRRFEVAFIIGKMMGNIIGVLAEKVSDDTLLDIVNKLPRYILNDLLDGYDTDSAEIVDNNF